MACTQSHSRLKSMLAACTQSHSRLEKHAGSLHTEPQQTQEAGWQPAHRATADSKSLLAARTHNRMQHTHLAACQEGLLPSC